MLDADAINLQAFAEAADARRLQIQDAERPHLQRDIQIAGRLDALVQADARLQALLQKAVLVDVIVRKRLLNHQQIELIQLRQMLGICDCVIAVGIEHQQDIGELGSHRPRHFDIPAALNLQLDAPVTLFQAIAHDRHRRFQRWLDADADADRRPPLGFMPSRRVLREAIRQPHVVALGEGIPNRRFQASPRMMIAAEAPYQRRKLARVADGHAESGRRHELRQHVPRRLGCLATVAGPKLNRAFAPTNDAGLGLQLDQQRHLVRLGAEAGFKGRQIGQEHGVQINRTYRYRFHIGVLRLRKRRNWRANQR